jgi:hypothetical protein
MTNKIYPFPTPPDITDLQIIKDMIIKNDLDMTNYITLINLVQDGEAFMGWLRNKFTERFSDDFEGLYRDYESLLMARDWLTTQAARAVALYRACKKGFKPSGGTAVDKEAEIDFKASPFKFYEYALEERIKTLDNRCTAAKQQQRIMEEAIKRNLISE